MTQKTKRDHYDDATLAKLDIFEKYLMEWLPVFILTPSCGQVVICDYFAGSGKDDQGELGSPLRIVRSIKAYQDKIKERKFHIDVLLNEKNPLKYANLEKELRSVFDEDQWKPYVTIYRTRSEFQDLLEKHEKRLREQPNLLFMDQYGIKELKPEVFGKLVALPKTDFLFFIASSFFKRFAEREEFKKHHPDIDVDNLSNAQWAHCHREVLEYYRNLIPKGNSTKLYPFSLRKENGNIYGLIFGSEHPLGVEKFLKVAWNKNKINGEANFDIDGDEIPQKKQKYLFSEMEPPPQKTKIQVFNEMLEEFIVQQGCRTNREIYFFTLLQGHPKHHARECVQRLKREKKVEFKGRPGFSYKACVKDMNIVVIKAVDNG